MNNQNHAFRCRPNGKQEKGVSELGENSPFTMGTCDQRATERRQRNAFLVRRIHRASFRLNFFTAPCLEFIDSSRFLSLLSFCALFRPIRRLCDVVPSWFLAAMHERKIAHKYYYYFLESASCTTDRQDRSLLSWKFRIFLR